MTNTTTTGPASDRQYSYLTDLLNEREGHGVTDIPAFLTILRTNGCTKAQMSKIIDINKALPKAAKPATNGNVRRNTYAGKCIACGVWVAEQAGTIVARTDGRKGFDAKHLDGECVQGGTPVAAITEGVYEKDGMVYRVTLSKGGNLYAQRAIVTPGQKLAWEYLGAKGLTLVAGATPITAETAARIGFSTHHCMFCSRKLTDEGENRSVDVGYGPVCAKRYNLPWGV